MASYLLSWDPTRWDWRNIKEQSDQVSRGSPVVRQWSCGSNRRIFIGDVVFFVRQGREPRGIFARAEVIRGSYEAMNVDIQDASRGRGTLIVDVRFTALENSVERVVIPRAALTGGALGKFVWDIRESGARIPDAVAAALETAWQAATGKTPAPTEKPKEKTKVKVAARVDKPLAATSAASAQPPVDVVDASAAVDPEQERLQREREARLQKIRAREAEQRRARQANEEPGVAAATQAPLSAERRNEVLVQNYFIMLDAELQGELYSKADHRNRIMQELRTDDAEAVDLAHCHVSAVLAETGLPFAEGFRPQSGFDPALEKAVHVFIEANPELVEALWLDAVPPASNIPVELDDAKAHWAATPESSGFRPSTKSAWHPAGVSEIDYRVRESWNRNLAVAGERFVLAFERARLREAGMKDALDQVAWQSQTFGESFGYDIRSLNEDNSERLICVKTTNYGARFPFNLTLEEIERARATPANFHVYRVFRFSRGAKLFIVAGNELLQETLEPVVFRAWI